MAKFSIVKYFIDNPFVFYAVLIVLLLIVQIVYVYFTRFERVITVKEKHEFSTGKYIRNTISDEEGNVYQVQSSLPLLHFKEAEIWLKLEKSKKYTILAYGLRIPILGLYPNIVGLVP